MRMKTCGMLKIPPEPVRSRQAKIFHPTWSGCHQERSCGLEEKSGILSVEFPGGDAPRTPPFLVSIGARLCIRYLPNIVLVWFVAWCMQAAQPELAGTFLKTCYFLGCRR